MEENIDESWKKIRKNIGNTAREMLGICNIATGGELGTEYHDSVKR